MRSTKKEFTRVKMDGTGPDVAKRKRQNKFDTSMDFHRFIRRLIRVGAYLFLVSELKNFGVEFFFGNIRHSI